MKIAKTAYEKFGFYDCPRCFPGEVIEASEGEAIAYLDADGDNAIVLVGAQGFVGVWRGAAKGARHFWVQELPLEDPGDATGGDLSAAEALSVAKSISSLQIKGVSHAERMGNAGNPSPEESVGLR